MMKIWKEYSRREKCYIWKARFEYNRKTFRPSERTLDRLNAIIAEIKRQEKIDADNLKFNIDRPNDSYIPTLVELFESVFATVASPSQRTMTKRVFKAFLDLLPVGIKVTEVDKTHFQKYVDRRLSQTGKQSNQPISRSTVHREIYLITGALRKAENYYGELKNFQVPQLPKSAKSPKRKSKRDRLVTEKELSSIIAELVKPPEGKQTHKHHFARVRLAHQIEFGYWTGLRRKEICRLKFSQYDDEQNALLNVRRFKTDTVTKFFPLAARAVAIIEDRRRQQDGSEYIFTPDGLPIESAYRTLKKVCEGLGINYGRFETGGFVLHDLRHNFGTDILQSSDIETARELLGHADISQTGTYIHTSKERLRDAVKKRDKFDYDAELSGIFKAVKNGEIGEPEFNGRVKKLFDK